MTKTNDTYTPVEAARLLGKKNPESIREGLRNGSFPIGFAYRGEAKWVYVIPKEPFDYFIKTGQTPPTGG